MKTNDFQDQKNPAKKAIQVANAPVGWFTKDPRCVLLSFSHTEGYYRLKMYPGAWAWICRARLVANEENW